MTVTGAIVLVVAATAVAAGGLALWLNASADHGYITSGSHRFTSQARAIVTDDLHVGTDVPHWLIARGRVTASSTNGKELFIGVARKRDVDGYLAGVSYSAIRSLEYGPFSVEYARHDGTVAPRDPAAQTFWATSDPSKLTWRLRSGHWRVVLMNADASPGVSADVTVGGRVGHAVLAGIVALVVGGLLALAGGALVWGARGDGGRPTIPVAA